ncbi:MAG: hypothetical protein OEN56_00110 [Gemmatimonadota bacterium]|nr:hypothetical protein [Gemmatimonadota bacterium]
MTDPDQLKPYHAKGAAPGQEAADVVAEVLQHAQEREAAAKKKVAPKGPPKWMLPLTVNLGVLALYFLIAQPDFLVVNPLDDPRPQANIVQDLKRSMYYDGVFRIQRFQSETGRLPESLTELGTSLGEQGVEYTVQGDSTYLLIATVGDETIVYDSQTTDPNEFVGTMRLPG